MNHLAFVIFVVALVPLAFAISKKSFELTVVALVLATNLLLVADAVVGFLAGTPLIASVS